MSENAIVVGLSSILVLGIAAQWIGRRVGIPSLLLLLPAGLLAGDVLGIVEPVELFGDTFSPLVTLLVSLLLFQAGSQLRLEDLPRDARGSVLRLVTIGAVVTFAGASVAVALALGISTDLAMLTGAILVVSGPTVVGPLLASVRPREPTGSVLLWEGTTLDPIGATLGVVVLNIVLAADRGGVHPLMQMSGRLAVGVVIGALAGVLLVVIITRFLVTDEMEAAVALMLATAAFASAEVLLSEAGLFATVTMGFVVANQRVVSTRRIAGFGETLEVVIIGTLFLMLGALVELAELREYAVPIVVIVAVLVLVVRPLAAGLSLVGSRLDRRERAMVGWMDPRGIVAAATATQFTTTLADAGFDVDFLLPVTFGVILGTGLVYGVTARPVASLLRLKQPPPTGVGLVGDDPWLPELARCLAEAGVSTLVVTTDRPDGRSDAVDADGDLVRRTSLRHGVAHLEQAVEDAGLATVVVSLTRDSALGVVEPFLIEAVGRRRVLRVPEERRSALPALVPERWSPLAFGGEVTRPELDERTRAGAMVRPVEGHGPDGSVVLAVVRPDGSVSFSGADAHATVGSTVLALVRADAPMAHPEG